MNKITSKENDLVKHIKKLKDKKHRDISKEYVIEGIKIIEEAIEEKANIKQIIICDECEKADVISKKMMYEIAKYNCVYVTDKVFESISDVKTPQGILAVIAKPTFENGEGIDYKQDVIIALDDIQDPGNLGTIIRTADSVGLSQILISKGTADAFNPKVVRSTMGAIFRVKVIECEDLVKTLKEIKKRKFQVVVTSLEAEENIYDMEYKKKVIVMGNEANGVSNEVENLADKKVKIPMIGKSESLNVSVAAGVILYEYVRKNVDKK